MDSPQAKRLKDARLAAGYSTAASAAEAFGWIRATYYAHENGNKIYTHTAAKKYGQAFRVNPAWLLFGQGAPETLTRQIPTFDSESVRVSFAALLTSLVPEMTTEEAAALVEAVLRLVELHYKRRGTKADLSKLSKAVIDIATLAWPPESE